MIRAGLVKNTPDANLALLAINLVQLFLLVDSIYKLTAPGRAQLQLHVSSFRKSASFRNSFSSFRKSKNFSPTGMSPRQGSLASEQLYRATDAGDRDDDDEEAKQEKALAPKKRLTV